jgi:hypothetical protein
LLTQTQNGTDRPVESTKRKVKKFPLAKDTLDKMLKDSFPAKDQTPNAVKSTYATVIWFFYNFGLHFCNSKIQTPRCFSLHFCRASAMGMKRDRETLRKMQT